MAFCALRFSLKWLGATHFCGAEFLSEGTVVPVWLLGFQPVIVLCSLLLGSHPWKPSRLLPIIPFFLSFFLLSLLGCSALGQPECLPGDCWKSSGHLRVTDVDLEPYRVLSLLFCSWISSTVSHLCVTGGFYQVGPLWPLPRPSDSIVPRKRCVSGDRDLQGWELRAICFQSLSKMALI